MICRSGESRGRQDPPDVIVTEERDLEERALKNDCDDLSATTIIPKVMKTTHHSLR